MRALAIAATGMNAQQTNMEVIANNIANINTTGFKRARAEFTDLLYQAERVSGAPTRGGQESVPEGAYVGLGTRTAAIRNLHIQGALTQTNNKLDLAVNGRGWFQIAGANGELFYTRAGAFNKNSQGQIVTLDGYQVQPSITIPQDAKDIVINESGEVFVTTDAQRDADEPRPAHARDIRQRHGPRAARQQSLQGDGVVGDRDGGRAGRSRLRCRSPGLPRALERRSGEGDHGAHLRAARL